MVRNWFILIASTMVSCGSLWAQKGEKGVSLNIGYGTYEAFRVGATFNYNVTDQIRLAPSFDYYFGELDIWGFSFDGHYLFSIGDRFDFYPLLGLTYLNVDENCFGGNVGLGFDYEVSDCVNLNLEGKYQIVNKVDDQFALKIGLAYKF